MATERKCGVCGGTGHDARTCPMRNAKETNNANDKVVWFRVSHLSDNQADKMTQAVIKAKSKIAPDAEGSFVKGDIKSLPSRIFKALGFGGDDKGNQ